MTLDATGGVGSSGATGVGVDALASGHAAPSLSPVEIAAAQARTGSPVEQGQALRALDGMTGDAATSDALARGELQLAQASGTPPPADSCRIEVRYTPVLGGIANHAFVVTSDADSTSYFRGGPSANNDGLNSGSSNSGTSGSGSSASSGGNPNAGIYGTIATEHGAYRPGTIDWTTSPSGQQDVATRPGNCDQIDRDFGRHADDIEAANISYGPLGPNSNSTAREILERGGFPNVDPVVWAPSWNIQLPMPR